MKNRYLWLISIWIVLAALTSPGPPTVEAAESEYRLCPTGTTCTIGEFLYDDDYNPVPPAQASCTLTIRDPSGTPLAGSPFTMSEASDGWYYHDLDTTGKTEGLYRATMCCDVGAEHLCLDKSFTIGPDVESAVWDADTSGHTTPGTFGWYLQNAAGLVKDIWEYSVRSLTTREITPTEHIAQEETLEKQWTTRFAGDGEILAGNKYRCKLWVLDYETELADAASTPTITIYDAQRNKKVEGVAMTKLSTGTYEYVYNVPSSATGGRWETVVDIDLGGAAAVQDGSYWEVESAPAEVKIVGITDNTVPSIVARVKITNEGGSGYEYQYAYCVVSQESNVCGGGDDVFYSSGAKYLNAGQSWTTNMQATVSNAGQYWFKVVVQWGTEKSAASRMFTAAKKEAVCLGDFNFDGWVNLTDFSILLYYWHKHDTARDLSGDGYVNLTDFSIMLYHWGRCP